MPGILEASRGWIEPISLLVELLAVAIIVVAVAVASVRYLVEGALREPFGLAYDRYKVRLGRGLLLGLEVLIAGDVIRTVALEPTLANASVLALLVVIRTFLSWSLLLEIEARWPWQPAREPSGGVRARP
jgi:uncharacterized membrane protein